MTIESGNLKSGAGKIPVLFFVCLPLFRLAGCAFLLLSNWVLIHENHTKNGLAASVALAFAPALLVGLISNSMSRIDNIKGTGISILLCAAFSLVASFFHSNTVLFLLIVFIMWFLFFAIDSLSEGWFAKESKGKSSHQLQQLGGINMAITQVAILVGPLLLAPLSRLFQTSTLFVAIGACFIVSSLFAFLRLRTQPEDRSHEKQIDSLVPNRDESTSAKIKVPLPFLMLLPFALVWPCLGLFNMMTPIAAHELKTSTVDYAAYVDALLACGMAISGALFATRLYASLRVVHILSIFGLFASVVFFLFPQGHWFSFASVTLLGMSFGTGRVALRRMAIERFSPQDVSRLIGKANAMGFPLICLFVFLYSKSLDTEILSFFPTEARHIIPCITFLLFFLFFEILILNKEKKGVGNVRPSP